MPATRPDLTDVRAVAVTNCPLLALHLAGLHPGVQTALLSRLAGIGTLRDTDALVLLTTHNPDGPHGAAGVVTRTLYVGTDLDDGGVWASATKLRADEVLFVPGDDHKLTARLTQHLGARA